MPVWAEVLLAIAGVAALAYLVYRVIETRRLRDHFGDEYLETAFSLLKILLQRARARCVVGDDLAQLPHGLEFAVVFRLIRTNSQFKIATRPMLVVAAHAVAMIMAMRRGCLDFRGARFLRRILHKGILHRDVSSLH